MKYKVKSRLLQRSRTREGSRGARDSAFHAETARGSGARLLLVALLATVHLLGCDGGITPPETERTGSIEANIRYSGTWPAVDSLLDIRFVAMRFIPRDTTDFLELTRLEFSDRLEYYVSADSTTLDEVRPGVFVYSGIALKYGSSLFAWRPVGVYDRNEGIFEVRSGEVTRITVDVDFSRPPDFPPAAP